MSDSGARSKWQETGGKAMAAAAAVAFFQRHADGGGPEPVDGCPPDADKIRRARAAYIGLFLLMVTVWSAILISAIFSLRINRESCEHCPQYCTCRGAPPAWG